MDKRKVSSQCVFRRKNKTARITNLDSCVVMEEESGFEKISWAEVNLKSTSLPDSISMDKVEKTFFLKVQTRLISVQWGDLCAVGHFGFVKSPAWRYKDSGRKVG